MASVNIYEAKTQLSKLIKRVRAGEEVIIADAGRPVAKLVPIEDARRARELGADAGAIWIADDAFAPMSREELAAWEIGGLFPGEPTARKRGRSSRKKVASTRRSRRSPS
jgi:prevent-host-death family protein